jgi:hypothetical protein
MPDDKRKHSPVDRFRDILSAEKDQSPTPETRKPTVVNLPRVGTSEQPPPAGGGKAASPPAAPKPQSRGWLPTFWTIACVVSLVLNAVLLILVLGFVRGLGGLSSGGTSSSLLFGLYSNFEQMDQAHLKADVPVQTTIPLSASIPVQTTSTIKLATDAAIQGAHVKISTALFNIDAPASVTLPAGTTLDVVIDMNLPVQADVPITMNVPFDIAVRDTELHPALLGLQDTIRPLLCATTPNAASPSGVPICQ